jgi:hypothetical protein
VHVAEGAPGQGIALDVVHPALFDLPLLQSCRLQLAPLTHRRFGSRIHFIRSGARRSRS